MAEKKFNKQQIDRVFEATMRGGIEGAKAAMVEEGGGEDDQGAVLQAITRFWWPIVKAWANEAAHRSGVASAKSTIFGKLVRRTLEPMSWMVGMVGTLRRLSFRTEFRYAHD